MKNLLGSRHLPSSGGIYIFLFRITARGVVDFYRRIVALAPRRAGNPQARPRRGTHRNLIADDLALPRAGLGQTRRNDRPFRRRGALSPPPRRPSPQHLRGQSSGLQADPRPHGRSGPAQSRPPCQPLEIRAKNAARREAGRRVDVSGFAGQSQAATTACFAARAFFDWATMAEKAAASVIARSERILRSASIPAAFRPSMKRE